MRRFLTVMSLAVAALIPCGGAVADQPAKTEQPAATHAKAPDGKPTFQKFKCNSCHSIATQGITKKPIEGEEKGASKQKPPDLSGAGVARKADWIALFL